MHSSELHHEYLSVYISIKNGSVFKAIPEIHRKKSTKMELPKFMFTLTYESKAKRNFFLGQPVHNVGFCANKSDFGLLSISKMGMFAETRAHYIKIWPRYEGVKLEKKDVKIFEKIRIQTKTQ